MLPADNHVHSQWSWDTATGDMEATCAEAVRLGLPSVAFTEHVDHTVWEIADPSAVPPSWIQHGLTDDGLLVPPSFEAEGYLAEVDRCRTLFPTLRIMTGVELGEPHWHLPEVEALIATGAFERVLGSLHSAPVGDHYVDSGQHYHYAPPAQVITDYLTELEQLITAYDGFQILAHIDYPVRKWPGDFSPEPFEEHYRHVLGLLRDAGKALEVNTRVPLPRQILQWWHAVGGEAISFASDAHRPDWVGRRFADAVALAESCGFAPSADPLELWHRG